MSSFDKKFVGNNWLALSDLTIFEAAFWMRIGCDPHDLEYAQIFDGFPDIEASLNDYNPDWTYDVHETGEVVASAARAGLIKVTADIHNGEKFDFERTRISKYDWLDWCRNHGYSELADRFTYPSNASPQENAAKGRAEQGTNPSGDDVEEQAPAADDYDETLAALFDPLPVEALAQMFITGVAQWKEWAERADRNGLKSARQGRRIFNPYKAGIWFVRNGAEGWDDARLYRTLANNLPARSSDKKHLLTGGID